MQMTADQLGNNIDFYIDLLYNVWNFYLNCYKLMIKILIFIKS
jgi:hypothetical protein